MKKEEILEKSRQENKNQDIYEKQIITKGGYIGAVCSAILAVAFYIFQILIGQGQNYGLFAIVFCILAVEFTYKYIKLKNKHELLVVILYWIATLCFAAAHIINLLSM